MPAIPELRLLYKNFAGDQADQIAADFEARRIQIRSFDERQQITWRQVGTWATSHSSNRRKSIC
jgi:hypothetical protein